MPGANLTRDEARERAQLLEVHAYVVDLDLTSATQSSTGPAATDDDSSGPTFRSSTTVTFTARDTAALTWLDLQAPAVREVTLNGRSLDPAQVYDGARVGLSGLAEENTVTVVADCAYMTTGEGLHRFVDPTDGEVYLYTQFEVPDARRMFATFEQPDLKATFTFTVTAPEHWEVVSNSATPEPEKLSDGVARWSFVATPRISTYITALVAGPWHVARDQHVGADGTAIPLGLFLRRSLAQHLVPEEIFDVTKKGLSFFESVFALAYPFGKYDQLFVPDFNAGAMENAGAVTFREEYIFRSRMGDDRYERRAETILHEMAHMWFGDLVTMTWWDDLWLNESFATWASVVAQSEATQWTDAWTTFANTEKLWALYQDQLPTTHPISADINDLEDVEVNFDGITYAKGASVLKQLVAWVGREQFLAGLKEYFSEHAWGNTRLADLFGALEKASGRDLEQWNSEWLRTAGVNTLRPAVELADDGTYASVAVLQEAAAEQPTLRSHRIAIGLYDRLPAGGFARRRQVELDVSGERTEVPELTGETQPDLLLLNDDDLTFAKIRFDERSLATVIQHIDEITESLPRALCWTAATDMLRDAELPARDFVEMVLTGIGRESQLSVVSTLLLRARSAVDLYADPSVQLALSSRWATGTYQLAHEAAPGSDHQLAFVRSWAAAAESAEHVAELRALLDGGASLPGLQVDTDLRWHLLIALVATGNADDADIEAELARDDTASGQRFAATAWASRPTLAAKEQAWRLVVEDPATSNSTRESALLGFVRAGQRELMRPFVDRYFAQIADIWRDRTMKTAGAIVEGLFPRVLVEQSTIDRVDVWLEEAAPVPALRRQIVEGRADLVRALQAQECDRAAGELHMAARIAPHPED